MKTTFVFCQNIFGLTSNMHWQGSGEFTQLRQSAGEFALTAKRVG